MCGGTGMITSSSTFCPHPGRVIRNLFRQLHAVWHGMEALVYRNHPGEIISFSYQADCQWRTLVSPLNCGANAALASVLW